MYSMIRVYRSASAEARCAAERWCNSSRAESPSRSGIRDDRANPSALEATQPAPSERRAVLRRPMREPLRAARDRRSTDPETGVASGMPEAAICVQDIDVQCVLQFTLVHAAGCALHRHTSRVIHRLELFVVYNVCCDRVTDVGTRAVRPRNEAGGQRADAARVDADRLCSDV